MNHPSPPPSSGGDPPPSPPRRDLQLQGPRPTPLKVAKTSHQIRKPPPHPHPHPQPRPPPPPSAAEDTFLRRDPVIIYTVSPRVIHATANDFMAIVQRLTGPAPPPASPSAGGAAVSPAARLAAVERTSPSERESRLAGLEEEEEVELGHFPGVLSPAPASLPAIPAGLFSPAWDPQSHLDLGSPIWHNIFVPSPSHHHLLSQSPSSSPSLDFFNLFDF